MQTIDLVKYYANLLILQYVGKAKNFAAIQTLATPVVMPQVSVQVFTFSAVAASGTIIFDYTGDATAAINWNDSSATIQTKLQAVTGLGSVTVSGDIISGAFTVTLTGVSAPAELLTVVTNTLSDSNSDAVPVEIEEIDETLPLAVQGAFNITGSSPARGVQLNVLGKYAGVTRTGNGFNGPITLNDSDFISLIKLAILKNNSGSSLAEIQTLINNFFAGEILVFDYKDMTMSYLVSSTLGSQDFIQLAIVEGLLPRPMAVAIRIVIFAPIINAFFAFRTYGAPAAPFTRGFNNYSSYQTDWPWLTYADAVII